MIIDRMSNIGMYSSLLPGLEEGLAAIEALGENPADGRYEFSGGFFTVQEADTRPVPEGEFEVHRAYIDVQIILDGQETVAWAHLSELTPVGGYNPKTDLQMLAGEPAQCNVIRPQMVWIAFPEDAHKAGRHTETPSHYRKIVMKLPVAEK